VELAADWVILLRRDLLEPMAD